MRIVKITFSNIHNLIGGPHVIDFEQSPLDTAGIFAITGPTGSGKSTILDVITLALFNRIPRFSRQISKNEIQTLGSVKTHHTEEAFAAIVYEVHQERYTSNWSIATTRTGNLKNYEMSLQDASGNYLDLNRSDVPGANEKIIGLNYEQFVKSILLSQGEFAKFLKADKNQRGELLESITGSDIYRRIGKRAYDKQKEIQANLQTEKEIIGNVQLLSQEEIIEFTQFVEGKTAAQQKIQTELNKLRQLDKIKTDIANSKVELEAVVGTQKNIIEEIAGLQSQLNKLQLHDKLSPLQGDLIIYQKAKEESSSEKENLRKYKSDFETATEHLKEVLKSMSELTHQSISENNFLSEMSIFERKINEMDSDLKHLTNKGKESRTRVNKRLSESSLALDSKIKPTEALKKLQNKKQVLDSSIKKSGFTAKDNVGNLESKLKTISENHGVLERIHHLIAHQKESEQQIENLDLKQNKCKTELARLEPLLLKSKELFEILEKQSLTLTKRKEDVLKIVNLESYRSQLSVGEPCPLCGSTEHPFSMHKPDHEILEIEKEIKEVALKLKEEIESQKGISNEISTYKTTKKITTESQEKLQNDLKGTNKEVDLKLKIYKGPKFDIENIDNILKESSEQIQNIEFTIAAVREVNIVEELQHDFTELQSVSVDYQKLAKKRKSLFGDEDISKVCNQLQDAFNNYRTTKEVSGSSIKRSEADLKRAEGLVLSSRKNLLPKLQVLGFDSIEGTFDKLLTEEETLRLKSTNEKLIKKKTSNETQRKTLESTIDRLIKSDSMPDINLEDLHLKLGEANTQFETVVAEISAKKTLLQQNEETKNSLKSRQEKLEKLTLDLEKWSLMNKLIGDSTGNKFSNYAQGLTLKNLLVQTNKRLLNLTDRYLLELPDDQGNLKVIDLYHGNIERSVTTLSGGETFLISLALALSLSDMASKNVRLDSLFIDEGFGTLDQETLDVAMDTLEKLQSESQKTVGVISHVQTLKERINVQIQLKRNQEGHSKIEVVS